MILHVRLSTQLYKIERETLRCKTDVAKGWMCRSVALFQAESLAMAKQAEDVSSSFPCSLWGSPSPQSSSMVHGGEDESSAARRFTEAASTKLAAVEAHLPYFGLL